MGQPVDRKDLLKAYKLVKGGATQAEACKKSGISLATYNRHRNAIANGLLPAKEDAQILKAKGHNYEEIAKMLKTSVSNAFKQATGKDLVDAVSQLAQERGVTRKEACDLLNISFKNHETARRQKNKDKQDQEKAAVVEPRVKRKYTKKSKVIDIVVPTAEQVQDERKSKKSNKVIVMVCSPENLANVLKGLE